MKIALISPSTKSLHDMSLMLEGGIPPTAVVRHEGGMSKLRNVAEQERPNIIIVEGMYHDASELAPVEFVTSHYPQTIVIMLCPQHTSEFLINAMRAGRARSAALAREQDGAGSGGRARAIEVGTAHCSAQRPRAGVRIVQRWQRFYLPRD
jgi:hypothetical protein